MWCDLRLQKITSSQQKHDNKNSIIVLTAIFFCKRIFKKHETLSEYDLF